MSRSHDDLVRVVGPVGGPVVGKAKHRATAAAEVAVVGLSVLSLACWVVATMGAASGPHDGLGRLSVVGPLSWVAFLCGVVGFLCAIRARHFRWPLALLALAAVIAVLYATPSLVEGSPRVELRLDQLESVGQLARTGRLDHDPDGNLVWPGSFAMLATLQQAAGVPELLVLTRWAPVLAAFAYLPPVLLIARMLSPCPRVQWLGAGVLVMVGWAVRAHLDPRTYALWLLLCITAVLLTVIRRADDPAAGTRIRTPRSNERALRLAGGGRNPHWWLRAGAAAPVGTGDSVVRLGR